MSATTDQRTSITTGIDVAIPPPSAFDVFTTGFDQWWNRNHHLLPGELAAVGIDPFAGGRVWERSVDGEECTWGEVLTWDPPRTFAFAWRI
ncbi:MAG: hypothetical protein QOG80_1580, partial [Pseudonocardiales bacterium]|nr:hypothetical protein [Pseudonocardiales bacterium]